MSDIWILYQTTNLVNGKIYVGVHKVADNATSRCYLGSGSVLKTAIKKYGRKKFKRTTLAEFCCTEDAYAAETQMVTEEFIKREDTYNLKMGGMGCRGLIPSPETRAKMSAALIGNTRGLGRVLSEEHVAKIRAVNTGKVVSKETRNKISAAHKGRVIKKETGDKIALANSKPVIINGKYYPSAKTASEMEGIDRATLGARIRNPKVKWVDYRFATEEEITNFLVMEVVGVENLNRHIC